MASGKCFCRNNLVPNQSRAVMTNYQKYDFKYRKKCKEKIWYA